MKKLLSYILISCLYSIAFGQENLVKGVVINDSNSPVSFAAIQIPGTSKGVLSSENGEFSIAALPHENQLKITSVGFEPLVYHINFSEEIQTIELKRLESSFEEVVVSGTLNAVSRMESPVPVEIYTPQFFKRNPTPNVFEALQNVNGVRPQVNCNVCNTGDIHINGLEGPYTMVLLDGMPIVSGLSTVYGLSGIPNAMIERIEIVKGPASSLYGSEAVGGLINIITKTTSKAPKLSADVMQSSWGETNVDLGFKKSIGDNIQALSGVNYFRYGNPIDKNGDNFTDLTLQNRISLFQKLDFNTKGKSILNLAGRYFYEDRWGGEMQWEPKYRGGDKVYGESIYTRRWEVLGKYQLPVDNLSLTFSYNDHEQNSFYGDMPFMATQRIGFSQLLWQNQLEKHRLTTGLAVRNTFYDDNTTATASATDPDLNQPQNTFLPGIFIQDEITLAENVKLLAGYRFDYHPDHKAIHTPRIALKMSPTPQQTLRLNFGTGFRVVNIFTEDHAALTGARDIIIVNQLNPERSQNINLNYMAKVITSDKSFIGLDFTAFYTHFNNRITPDYETNAQQIIYRNLEGFAVSKGISANIDLNTASGFTASAGATLMENTITEDGISRRPLLTERFQGVWSASLPVTKYHLKIDYTGNLYSPMKLPVLGEADPRPENSPWWSIQNIQLTWQPNGKTFELYGGIKNLLNFTPPANSIARAFDPFDRKVDFAADGSVIPSASNPYALTFDPSYVFAPNQGIRGFFGLRWSLK
ncbi:TonB-dependent receptor [Jiulongibacter sediminis]|uniref:TonB-dependent receptor n=1 Tax=Jiulongibacter sediminis TaxID=1605367 RepID=A0A0P7C2K0_9BACT|nr:TonB-dependent receptor [Jiulongibacter sediminis]KPM47541.1 TonB-dependent receptor [Jiulongibacter sediminis]TBX23335.1 TonB-dependent receptor [Jiulongibacter sediminis]